MGKYSEWLKRAGIRRIFLIAALCLALFPGAAVAGGPVHGAGAAGMGTAFVAVADDPSAILFNPGGLTQMRGTSVYGGITALAPSTTYTSPSGGSETTESRVFFPGHLYLVSDSGNPDIVFGVGLYSPFGIGGRTWSRTGQTRYLSTESSIGTFSVNPTLAWRMTPSVSVAAGIDYMRAAVTMERMIDQSSLGAPDGRSTLEADGDGWGYNLGALIALRDDLRVGFAYRSRIPIDYQGDMTIENIAPPLQPLFGSASYATAVRTRSVFPDIWSVGMAYLPVPQVVVDLDVELVRWSTFARMDMDILQEVPAAGLVDGSTPLDWKDSLQYKIGLAYQLSDKVSLRTGYAFIKTSVPDHTLEPGNPDADQHNFSVGAGYRSDEFRTDLFYNYGLYEKRSVQNSMNSGEYDNTCQYLGLSFGRDF
ncbi:MAG: outer membrane protein transport protein [Nitrospirota bacterium]|nr:outer membrane protein transport protein [Nitrospirota bacterium]